LSEIPQKKLCPKSMFNTPLKLEIMKKLRSPKTVAQLEKSLRISRNTIKPHIQFLFGKNLIEKNEKGYTLTNLGQITLAKMENLEGFSEFVENLGSFFTTHSISNFPPDLMRDMHLLRNGELTHKEDPFELRKEFIDRMRSSNWVYIVTPVYYSSFPKLIFQLTERIHFKIIVDSNVLDVMIEEYSAELKDFLGSDSSGELYICKRITEAFWVSDIFFVLYLFRENVLDPNNVFSCSSKECLEWGASLFNSYLNRSKVVLEI